MYVVVCCLVVSTSAVDCLERLVPEMTCYVSSGTLNPTHSLSNGHRTCLLIMMFRDVKDKCQRLEPGCSALYTWQDPMGKRELVWRCPQHNKDFKDELLKVYWLNWWKFKITVANLCATLDPRYNALQYNADSVITNAVEVMDANFAGSVQSWISVNKSCV